ncbi:MAG: beta-phosphoglucomutase [Chryseolinea sp.]
MIKACIFDLDGVIVDTAQYHYLAWNRLAKEIGIPFTETDNERLKGVSRMQSLDIILELGGVTLSKVKKERLATEKNTWFVDYINRMAPDEIFPGIKTLLERLRKMGMKVALASSSKNANRVVQLLNIKNSFDVIVDGTMVVNSKPDPEIFLLAASKLRISPEHCLVFEDAEAGVEAALAAGMRCIGIGSPLQLGKANKVIAKAAEFPIDFLQQL